MHAENKSGYPATTTPERWCRRVSADRKYPGRPATGKSSFRIFILKAHAAQGTSEPHSSRGRRGAGPAFFHLEALWSERARHSEMLCPGGGDTPHGAKHIVRALFRNLRETGWRRRRAYALIATMKAGILTAVFSVVACATI